MSVSFGIADLTFWEFLWDAMHWDGWNLKHYSFSSEASGKIIHLILARKGTNEVICSAPTMAQVVAMIYEETREVS